MITTKFTTAFGIQHPIVQGGMQWVGRAELVSAVANAGGLGMLTALTQPTPEDLIKEIARTKDMTNKPFGVNLTILPTLKPIPFEAYAQAVVDADIKIIETAGRNPEPFMPLFKKANIKVIHKCTSVRHAIKAEKIGCDAVSIDGFECAGHPGEDDIPALILIPRTTSIINIPVIASGGFANGQGLVAALALGAAGINMGTRFLATVEAPIHQRVKQALIDADEKQTQLIFRSFNNTARVFKNKVAEKVVAIESKPNTSFDDVRDLVSGEKGRKVFEDGDMEHGIWAAGLVTGLIHDIPTIDTLIHQIITDAETIIQSKLPTTIQSS